MKTRLKPIRPLWRTHFQGRFTIRPPVSLFRMTGILVFLVLFSPMPGQADFETIEVPMTLEYDLMNALAADAVFTGPEKQAVLLGKKDGCQVVMVSDPRFHEADGSLFIDLRVHVRYGFPAGPSCLLPVSFDGYLTARQQPVLDPETWQLRFTTVSSHLETRSRRPARLADFIWQQVQKLLPELLAPIVIDLGVPQKELGMFLKAVLPKDKPEQVLTVIQSLRPGPIEIRKTHLTFLQRMDIPETIYKTAAPAPPPVFSRNQKRAFIEAWEIWDAFMVSMITALAPRPLDDDEQDILLDLLLRLRYAFSRELDNPDPDGKDFVRNQFILSWKRVSPVFRKHLKETKTASILGYLSFFSAADTLAALDRLGPLLGLDISRQGLHQLAMLLAEGRMPPLTYDPDIFPALIKTLGIEKTADREAGLGSRLKQARSLLHRMGTVSEAWADTPANTPGNLREWTLQDASAARFLEKTTSLVASQAEKRLQETRIPKARHAMYRRVALATAWQESCFRQFVLKNDDITYLRSYNQTSVGIMQINERVWRGIYDLKKLRWDIAYNAMTGCEILELYFNRYAIPWMNRQPDRDWDDDFLAGMLYAIYSGGPGHLEKYVQRRTQTGSSSLSDRLFQEKWEWVKKDALEQAGRCLTGRSISFARE
jgi:hypothetical protein